MFCTKIWDTKCLNTFLQAVFGAVVFRSLEDFLDGAGADIFYPEPQPKKKSGAGEKWLGSAYIA